MITKEEFYWVWRNSKRENILNQFYYEHYDLLEALERINKAIEYIKEDMKYCIYENRIDRTKLLEILGDGNNE